MGLLWALKLIIILLNSSPSPQLDPYSFMKLSNFLEFATRNFFDFLNQKVNETNNKKFQKAKKKKKRERRRRVT